MEIVIRKWMPNIYKNWLCWNLKNKLSFSENGNPWNKKKINICVSQNFKNQNISRFFSFLTTCSFFKKVRFSSSSVLYSKTVFKILGYFKIYLDDLYFFLHRNVCWDVGNICLDHCYNFWLKIIAFFSENESAPSPFFENIKKNCFLLWKANISKFKAMT